MLVSRRASAGGRSRAGDERGVRVLMIAFTDYPADTRVRREAEALVARGHRVDVVCSWTPQLGDRRCLDGVRIYPTGRLEERSQLGPLGYVARDVGFLLRAAAAALRLQRRNRYDLVQVHTMPDYLIAAAALPKLMGARILLDMHDLVPELYEAKFGVDESNPVVKLTKLVERCCLGFADHALAVHQAHLDALLRHGNPAKKFDIIMNVPDPRFFTRRSDSRLASDRFVLLYHGTIARRHGLESAVRAVEIARQTYDDIQLQIVGDGDDVERLSSLVDDLDMGDAVEIRRGRLPIEQLGPILDGASAGIVPLVDSAFTRNMLPVKLLEYVALGIPVISSSLPNIRAYFDETMVLFFRSGDEEDLASKILQLRADPGLRNRLVVRADTFLEEHSWEREGERYCDVVESLTNAREPFVRQVTQGLKARALG
jgi:glycosyltransferase involved in cell wall biosynthesis